MCSHATWEASALSVVKWNSWIPVVPIKLTSAVHTPAGNLNLNVLSLSFHTPKALPAVATFTFVEDGTLKFWFLHQLK